MDDVVPLIGGWSDGGLKAAVAPEGKPVIPKVTGNPEGDPTVIV
jgi:hypothetical protein